MKFTACYYRPLRIAIVTTFFYLPTGHPRSCPVHTTTVTDIRICVADKTPQLRYVLAYLSNRGCDCLRKKITLVAVRGPQAAQFPDTAWGTKEEITYMLIGGN